MDNRIPTTAIRPGRLTYSCVRCANRKVKCDRQRPSCGACVKHNVECIFNAVHAPQRKRKRVKVQALTDRLRQYQNILREHGINDPSAFPVDGIAHETKGGADAETGLHQSSQNSSKELDHQYINRMRIVDGQVHIKFVENSLWTKVFEESHDAGLGSEDSDYSTSSSETEGRFDFVLSSRPRPKRKPRQPSTGQAQYLWNTFVENVDPLTKIVHVPTLRPAIIRAIENPSNIPRNIEALLFAIYSIATMSLQEHDCQDQFSESRMALLSHFISATEKALSRANVMATTNIIILQALVLHLTAAREIYEPRAVWTLTGVAVRISQVMGLERDGAHLGLPVFETEMRRRIWWQLKHHDFRAAELCGLAKFRDIDIGSESTSWPTSLNDAELYPGMSQAPVPTDRITDSMFIDLRCELTKFAAGRVTALRNQGKDSSQWNLDAFKDVGIAVEKHIKELEQTLETKYVRYCDPSQPLHLISMLMARYAMNTVRFLSNHPRNWTDQTTTSDKQGTWKISVTLLEQHCMIKTDPLLKGFAWHAAYFQQWHALIHVLDTLRIDPSHADADKIWRLLGSIYDATPAMANDTKKPIYAAVANLCLKAYSAREAVGYVQQTPDFILKLREKQEQARTRRAARSRKQSYTGNNQQSPQKMASNSAYLGADQPQLSLPTSSQEALPPGPGIGAWDPMEFSFMDEFENLNASPHSIFDVDLDTILGMENNVGSSDSRPIRWDQWDAWLSESNIMRPMQS